MSLPEFTWGTPENQPPVRGIFPPPAEGAPANRHPFRVLNAGAGNVTVLFGMVNATVPTIGGTSLSASPSLGVGTGYVYLAVTMDVDGDITDATVQNAASLPADDATHAYLALAAVTVSGGEVTAINQSVTNSLAHRRCGVSSQHFWAV